MSLKTKTLLYLVLLATFAAFSQAELHSINDRKLISLFEFNFFTCMYFISLIDLYIYLTFMNYYWNNRL